MKFSEIPQFPRCPYRTDVDWDYLERHIKCAESELGLNLEPDFQRAHVWTAAQQTAYVEYILKGGTSGKELYFNHPGWMRDWQGEYVIVDGKQRLQAVRLFMADEIPAFGLWRHEYEGNPSIMTASFSWNIAALATRVEVLQWYLAFNAGGIAHTSDELARVEALLIMELNND